MSTHAESIAALDAEWERATMRDARIRTSYLALVAQRVEALKQHTNE